MVCLINRILPGFNLRTPVDCETFSVSTAPTYTHGIINCFVMVVGNVICIYEREILSRVVYA